MNPQAKAIAALGWRAVTRLTLARAPVALVALVALSTSCSGLRIADRAVKPLPGQDPQSTTKLVLISWDGAPDWVLDRLLEEEALPNLQALIRGGMRTEHSVTSFPSKTASGHATLWTGCWPNRHGISANSVPRLPAAAHTLLDRRRGFASTALTAEPLYVTAAKQGKKVVVLSATHQYPSKPHEKTLQQAGVAPDRLLSFSGFEHRLAPRHLITGEALQPAGASWGELGLPLSGAKELEVAVADSTFQLLFYDDPQDPIEGLDTLLIEPRDGGGSVRLKAHAATDHTGGWSSPFPVRQGELEGNTFFRLFQLSPDGTTVELYQRSVNAILGSEPRATAAYTQAYRGFHDDPFLFYERGGFGPPLMAGGDGTAEERAVEVALFDSELLIEGTRFALEHWKPDLLFHYSPMGDSAGHSWVGLLDPSLASHDTRLAARLWPFYRQIFQQLDRWLGTIRSQAPKETVVALVSDHGMAGTDRLFHVNEALHAAGLLRVDEQGKIDLARTRVLLPAFGDIFVKINGTENAQGIVPPEEREAVLAAAEAALLEARDPDTNVAPISRLWRASELADLGAGGPSGGDLYLDLAPGYYPTRGLPKQLVSPNPIGWPKGNHGFWPHHRSMHAIFFAAGPGLRQGVQIPPIRHIDVAPTLAHLLGLRPPAQAVGRVIDEALASQEP
ncbi:MAG: alkaline phosphatase family protein [Deltaproteobacteria bacterium]|nr:alkaline phosphatase family protein [Deltaproteobacteria bacterium]